MLLIDKVDFLGSAAAADVALVFSFCVLLLVTTSTSPPPQETSLDTGLATLAPVALSPAELSVLDAILAALGCDNRLLLALLPLDEASTTSAAAAALVSGMAWGFLRMLPSIGLAAVPKYLLLLSALHRHFKAWLTKRVATTSLNR